MRTALKALIAAGSLGSVSLNSIYKTAVMALAAPGVPVDDFPVGRTSTNVLAIAVGETKPILSASTTSITFASNLSMMKGQLYPFTVDQTKYPGRFEIGAYITFVDAATAGQTTPNYINGVVETWNQTTGVVGVRVNTGSYGAGGVGAGTAFAPLVGTAGATYSLWNLNLHLPANHNTALKSKNYVTVNGPAATQAIADWDFTNLHGTFTQTPTNTVTANYLNYSQCLFDQANLPTTNTQAGFFQMAGGQPFTLTNCSIAWNWRRFAVSANVTAVSAAGSTTITVDAIPPQPDAFLLASQASGIPIDSTWRILNVTNPTSLGPTLVKSISGNVITVPPNVTNASDTYGPTIQSQINVGDKLMFFPNSTNSFLVGGSIQSFMRNSVAVWNDFYNPSAFSGAKFFCSQNEIAMLGASKDLHADFWQFYNWTGGSDVEIANNAVTFGYVRGDEALSQGIRCGNPRDLTVGSRQSPIMNNITWRDNIFLALPEFRMANMLYYWDQPFYPIIGIRQNAVGNARVTIGSYGFNYKGGAFVAGDIWKVSGSSTAALNGPQAITGGNPSFTGSLTVKTNAVSAAGQPNVYFATATISANALSMSKGSILYNGGTALGTILSVDQNNTFVTLDTNISASIASGVNLALQQFFDTNIPYSTVDPNGVQSTALAYSVGATTMTVASATGMQVGMLLSSSAAGLGAGTLITAINGNVLSLSVPTVGSAAAGATITANLAVMPCTTALVRHTNLYFRNLLVTNGISQLVNTDHGMMAGVSIDNIRDADTAALLPFSYANDTSYNPKLPAPIISTIAKTGSGVFKISLGATISGALGYQVTLDGGTTWTTLSSDGSVSAAAGNYQVGVRAMNCANDLGAPVNPGAPSIITPFSLAA